MRFQFLKPRKDVASAEQVRALRQRRGWTLDQMADEVHASPVEVTAWEAGTVRVPAKQALLIHWQTAVAAWAEALDAVQERTCPWVPENAPALYEQMFKYPAARWYAEKEPVRAHLAECAHCKAVWKRAQRIGAFPGKPDTSGSLWSRYWRWVERLPDWASVPFIWAGLLVPVAGFGLPILTGDRDAGLWGYVQGLGSGMVFGMAAYLLASVALDRLTRRPIASLLNGLAAGAGGLLGWALFDSRIDLGDPRQWAVAMTVGLGLGLLEFRTMRAYARRYARALEALAPGTEPRSLLSPELDARWQDREAAIRDLIDERRAHHAAPLAGGDAEPGVLERGTPA
jgi:transcriptional regulator with XRE-family HTH domain